MCERQWRGDLWGQLWGTEGAGSVQHVCVLLSSRTSLHTLNPSRLQGTLEGASTPTQTSQTHLPALLVHPLPLSHHSTVIHERGSPETLRDPRGFAVKFYTREGNFDMVGNNIPVSAGGWVGVGCGWVAA